MSKKTIKEHCDNYLKQVVDDGAGWTQIKETEQAFYAGALAMHQLALSFCDDQHTDEQAEAMLAATNDELMAYFEKLSSKIASEDKPDGI